MAVYLDANIIPERGDLPTLELATIVALARENSLAVYIPELALEEVLSRFKRALITAQEKLQAASAEAAKFWSIPSIYIPDPDELVNERRTQLKKIAGSLAFEAADAHDALLREVWRRRPAREGKGARDSAIWRAVVQHHRSVDEAGFFLSRNTADFASPDGDDWVESLALEIADCVQPLSYCKSPEELFARLAKSDSTVPDREALSSSEALLRTVASFIQESRLYAECVGNVALDGEAFLAGPVSASLKDISQARSFVVDENIISITWTDWSITCLIGVMRRFPYGSYSQFTLTAKGTCRLQLLLRLTRESGLPISAEVTGRGKCHLAIDPDYQQ